MVRGLDRGRGRVSRSIKVACFGYARGSLITTSATTTPTRATPVKIVAVHPCRGFTGVAREALGADRVGLELGLAIGEKDTARTPSQFPASARSPACFPLPVSRAFTTRPRKSQEPPANTVAVQSVGGDRTTREPSLEGVPGLGHTLLPFVAAGSNVLRESPDAKAPTEYGPHARVVEVARNANCRVHREV